MASNSNRGQGGIQQLLAAEQEAQRIVNAAKNGICSFHFLSCLSMFLIGLAMISSNYWSNYAALWTSFELLDRF
jgi:hypothetical protein